MLHMIYIQPLWLVCLEILLPIPLWALLGARAERAGQRRRWRLVNLLLFLPALLVVLYATLLDRSGGLRELVLRPFSALSAAREQPELYRAMLMNVLLFVPFGLSLPELLPRRLSPWTRAGLTLLCALLLSTGVEALQYLLRLGRTETDDVLCNALGAALASLSAPGKARLFRDK